MMLTSTRLPIRSASGTVTSPASHVTAPRPSGPVPASPGPASTSVKASPPSVKVLVMTSEASSASPHGSSITIVIITESSRGTGKPMSRSSREPLRGSVLCSTATPVTKSSPIPPEASPTSPRVTATTKRLEVGVCGWIWIRQKWWRSANVVKCLAFVIMMIAIISRSRNWRLM